MILGKTFEDQKGHILSRFTKYFKCNLFTIIKGVEYNTRKGRCRCARSAPSGYFSRELCKKIYMALLFYEF